MAAYLYSFFSIFSISLGFLGRVRGSVSVVRWCRMPSRQRKLSCVAILILPDVFTRDFVAFFSLLPGEGLGSAALFLASLCGSLVHAQTSARHIPIFFSLFRRNVGSIASLLEQRRSGYGDSTLGIILVLGFQVLPTLLPARSHCLCFPLRDLFCSSLLCFAGLSAGFCGLD